MSIILSGIVIIASSIILGFIFCDRKKGISMSELKISGTVAIIASIYFANEINGDGLTIILSMMASWLALVVGIIIGEMIKIKIFNFYEEGTEEIKNKVSVKIMKKIGKALHRG